MSISCNSGTVEKSLIIVHSVTGKEIFRVSTDNRVTLGIDLILEDVEKLDMPYLLLLREIVNVAIYDKNKR